MKDEVCIKCEDFIICLAAEINALIPTAEKESEDFKMPKEIKNLYIMKRIFNAVKTRIGLMMQEVIEDIEKGIIDYNTLTAYMKKIYESQRNKKHYREN